MEAARAAPRERALAWSGLVVFVLGQGLAVGFGLYGLFPLTPMNMYSTLDTPFVELRVARAPGGPALSAEEGWHIRQHRAMAWFLSSAPSAEDRAARFGILARTVCAPGESLVCEEYRWWPGAEPARRLLARWPD